MKLVKKIITIPFIVIFIWFVFLFIYSIIPPQSPEKSELYPIINDNKKLADYILSYPDGTGSFSSINGNVFELIVGNNKDFRYSEVDGISILSEINSQEQTANISLNCEIKVNGMIRLVAIDEQNNITDISNGNYNGVVSLTVPKGKTRIVLAGAKAKGIIKISKLTSTDDKTTINYSDN